MADQTLAEQAVVSPVNVQEFSKKVKEKYPEYKDVDDLTLAQKIVEKYPEYKDRVSFDQPEPGTLPEANPNAQPEQSLTYMQKELRQKFPENYSIQDATKSIIQQNDPETRLYSGQIKPSQSAFTPENISQAKVDLQKAKEFKNSIVDKDLSFGNEDESSFGGAFGALYDYVRGKKMTKEQMNPEALMEKINANSKNEVTRDIVNKQINILENVTDGDANKAKKFWNGLTNLDVLDLLTVGLKGMGESVNIYGSAKRYSEGKATPEDENLLIAKAMYDEASNLQQKDRWTSVGSGLSDMAPWLAQFALTGGIGTGVTKATTGVLGKSLAAKAASKLIGVGAQTLAQVPNMVGGTAERMTDQYQLQDGELLQTKEGEGTGEAFGKTFGNNFLEVLSERVVGDGVSAGWKGAMNKLVDSPRFGKTAIADIVNWSRTNKAFKTTNQTLGLHSPITENIEEMFTGFTQPIVTADGWKETKKEISDYFTKENLIRTFVTTVAMGGGMAVAQSPLTIAHSLKSKVGQDYTKEFTLEEVDLWMEATGAKTVDERTKALAQLFNLSSQYGATKEQLKGLSHYYQDYVSDLDNYGKLYGKDKLELPKPITTATIEGQQYTINNPEDLGIEGKPIFAKDAEGNVIPVSGKKKDLIADVVTQTQGELDQAQQAAADRQALMQGILDPNAQVVNDENFEDEGTRIVDFSNGQSKIIYNGQEVIANDVNEKDAILNSINDFQKLPEPKPQSETVVSTEPKTFNEQIPKKTVGKKQVTDYESATPQTTIGALTEDFEDPLLVQELIDTKISDFENQIAKVGKVKVIADIDQYKQNLKEAKEKTDAINKQLGYWKSVKTENERQKAEAERLAKEQKQADTNILLEFIDEFNATPQSREDKQQASDIEAIAKKLGYQTERTPMNEIRLFDASDTISKPKVSQKSNSENANSEIVPEIKSDLSDTQQGANQVDVKSLQKSQLQNEESEKVNQNHVNILGSFAIPFEFVVKSKGSSSGRTVRKEIKSKVTSDGDVLKITPKNTFKDDGNTLVTGSTKMSLQEFKDTFYPKMTQDEIDFFEETIEGLDYKTVVFKEARIGLVGHMKGQVNIDVLMDGSVENGIVLKDKLTNTELNALTNEKPLESYPIHSNEGTANQGEDTPQAQQGQGNQEGLEENVNIVESNNPKNREELESRLREERKQRILSEGTGFDNEFGLIQPKDIKSADDVISNVNKIITTLKENEGNGKFDIFEGYAYKGNYSKNAGEQIRGYFMALDVLPDKLRNDMRKAFSDKLKINNVQELMDWAEKQYKQTESAVPPVATISQTPEGTDQQIEQAAAEVNTNPTEAQKEAGNYKKGHVKVQGMDITIENPKGSFRKGVDEDGKAWENVLQSHYGYFKRTIGKDNDHIDTFIGDNPESDMIFVVDQNSPKTGKFDESKVMTGFNSVEEAKAAYLANYEPDWKGFRSITAVPVDQFKEWLLDGAKQNKPFADYKETPSLITPDVSNEFDQVQDVAGQDSGQRPAVLEPWQMTRNEWESNLKNAIGSNPDSEDFDEIKRLSYNIQDGKGTGENNFATHKDVIKQAIADGKPVPQEVLNDYPELKKEQALPRDVTGSKSQTTILIPKGSRVVDKRNPKAERFFESVEGNNVVVATIFSDRSKKRQGEIDIPLDEFLENFIEVTESGYKKIKSQVNQYEKAQPIRLGGLTEKEQLQKERDLLNIAESNKKEAVKSPLLKVLEKGKKENQEKKQSTPLPEEKQNEVRFRIDQGQTNTPEFKEWFGKSVFTENGKVGGTPLVLYHGTDRNFDSFRPDRMIYLTPSAEYANMYTVGQSAKGAHYVGKSEQELAAKTYSGESVMPVFARAENPFDTRNPKHKAIFQKEYFGKYGNGAPLDNERGLPDWTDAEDLQEFFDEKGYDFDGLVLAESHGNITYAVFTPNQVKSATGNSGEFGKETDDIRFRTEQQSQIVQDALKYSDVNDFIDAYKDADFRDSHSAPGNSGSDMTIEERMDQGDDFNLAEVVQGFSTQPNDYFDPRNGARWYGYDDKEGMQSYYAIKSVMSDINGQVEKSGKITKMPKIKAYRAVPKGVEVNDLIDGDWITFSKEYAKGHGENRFGRGEYKIISQNIPANEVWWDGNDINEWGYDTGKTESLGRSDLKAIWENAHAANRFRIIGETGAGNLDREQEVTTRLDNLAIAREMEVSGKDAKTISLATGWEKGVDGKWRYETSDNIEFKNIGARLLGQVLGQDHELFKSYPKLRFIEMGALGVDPYERAEGSFHQKGVNGKATIYAIAPTEEELKSVLVHEIQHAIQISEGFAGGGIIEMNGQYSDLYKEAEQVENVLRKALKTKERYNQDWLLKEVPITEIIEDARLSKNGNIIEWAKNIAKEGDQEIKDFLGNTARGKYMRLAGEVESRNVQTRMNMTPEERRNALLSETEDVAREDQIVLMEGLGVSNLEEPTKGSNVNTSPTASADLKSRPNVVNALTKISDELGEPVYIINSSEIPEKVSELKKQIKDGNRVPAFFYNGKIYLLSDQVTSVSDALKSYLHELIVHKGLRDVFAGADPVSIIGKQYAKFNDLMVDVFGSMSRSQKIDIASKYVPGLYNQNGKIMYTPTAAEKALIGEEFLAHVSENQEIYDEPTLSRWQQFINRLWQIVRKAFRLTSNQFSQKDLTDIVRESRERLKNKAQGETEAETRLRISGLYHGSPHSFDKFTTDKIGTGEGAHAYGWGLYFTDKKEIAEQYANKLVMKDVRVGKTTAIALDQKYDNPAFLWMLDYVHGRGWNKDQIINELDNQLSDTDWIEKNKWVEKNIKQAIEVLSKPENDIEPMSEPRNLYSITLHEGKTPEQYDYLRWDKPVSREQQGKIFKQLREEKIFPSNNGSTQKFWQGNSVDWEIGSNIYDLMANTLGSEKKSSEFLLRAGIDGIQYPTEYLSKGSQEDSFNYVVFDENAVTVDEHAMFRVTDEKNLTINIDGVERSTLNSNGKPIANSEEGIRNFWKWFGDSKVVDTEGRPLVVYHGTKQDFDVFGRGKEKQGMSNAHRLWYFTNDISMATTHAGGSMAAFKNNGKTGSIMPVYLSLQNPNTLDARSQDSQDAIEDVGYWASDDQLDDFQRRGFDGIMLDDFDQIVVLNPSQIKSATGNNGSFSPESNDIRFRVQPIELPEGVKKVKGFKTEEGNFSYYDTEFAPRGRAQYFTVLEDKKGWIVRNVILPETEQGKGIATQTYRYLNQESLKKTGNPLRSSRPRIIERTGEKIIELSKDGEKLWDRLVSKGFAIKTGDKQYEFIAPEDMVRFRVEQAVEDLNKINSLPKSKQEAIDQTKEDFDKTKSLFKSIENLKEMEESKVGKKVAERRVIIKQISAYKKGYRAGVAEKRLTLQVVQRNIIKYANDNMNYDDATRFEITQLLTAIKNANTPATIEKVFDKIDELASRGLKRKLMNRIERAIKSASPKLQSGKPTGKLAPESYQAISNIKRLIEMTPDQYDNYLELISDDDVESITMASLFGNLKEKSIDETFEALKVLNSILSDGRTWYKDKIEALKTRHKQLIEKAVDDITGGKGIQSTQNIRSENGVVDKNSYIKEFLGKNQSFEWLLDLISNNKKDRTGWGFMQDHFGDLANKSENLESKGLRESIELVNKKAFEIFGKEKSALAKIFGENSRVIKKSGVTYATNDGRKEIPLSQNEAYKRWMEMSDPTLFPTFEKMGWDSQSLTEIEKFLNPKVLAWAKWQVSEFFPEYYKRVNDVYKKMYYVDLPFNPSYSGFLKREKTSVGDKEDTMLRPDTLIGSVANSSLKSRIKNIRDIVLQDGDQALAKHIAEMEHFMAWAETIREIRAVLSSDSVQDAIKKEHGNNIRTVLNERINSLVRGGVDRGEVNYLVDWVRKNYVTSALGVNLSLTPKQMTAMFSYLNDISIMDYIKGAAEFMANPAQSIEILSQSEFVQRRYKKGWTHEIEAAMKKNNPNTLAGTKSTINSIRDALMLPVMLGDKFAVYSGYPVYAKFYKQFKAENPTASEQAAHDFALNKFERVTKRTQQSSDVSDTSRFQETSFGKVFMMFKNAQQQYFRYEMAAINNLIKGKGNTLENAKIILITHVVLPVIFQMVANWFTDEDDDKENKRLLRAALLGPIDGLMIAGDIVGYGLEKMMGEKWSYSASPMLDTVQDLGNSIQQLVKYINEPYPENEAEDLQKALDFAIQFTSSTMTGIPYEPVKKLYNKATGDQKKELIEEDASKIISEANKYHKFLIESIKREDTELHSKLMSNKTAFGATSMLVISDPESGRKSYESRITNHKKAIKYWKNIKTDEAQKKVDEYELMLENTYKEIIDKYSEVEFPDNYKLKK